MQWWRVFQSWIAVLWHRSRFEAETDDELRFHLEQQTDANIRRGMSPDAARREALRLFGGVEQIREQVRETAGIHGLHDFVQDLRFAGRLVTRAPGFALLIVLILGLAIGLSTTIFSFVQAILIRPLPYPDADRLVIIRTTNPAQDLQWFGASGHDFLDWQREATSFAGMAAFHWTMFDLTDGRSSERVQGMFVSRHFFDVIGIPPELGRSFEREEEDDAARTLVLSQDVWVRRYKGDPDIVGKTVDVYSWASLPRIGATAWEVVGVVGREVPFLPTVAGVEGRQVRIDEPVQFWRPLAIDDEYHRGWRDLLTVVARLKPGVTAPQANAEMQAISRQLAEEYPDTNRGWTAQVVPLSAMAAAEIRPALLLLSGAVGFLLLIACANVGSLLLVRGIARQQEMAIRIAVGAGRFRLMKQLVTESVLLCFLSGSVGVLLTVWSIDVIRGIAPADVPRLREIAVDMTVLCFAAGLSVLTGIVVGVLPALFAVRTDVNESLKSGGRGTSTARSRRRLMGLLVATETAVCLVLLTGAVLLIRSFISITAVDPGFRTDHLLTITVSLPQAKYAWAHNSEFCVELLKVIRAVPGVENASAIRGLPMRETRIDVPVFLEGSPDVPLVERPKVRIRVVEPAFFKTMEVPLLEGRLFEPADSVGKIGYTRVVVCNQTLARRFWPNASAIGKRFAVVKPEYDLIEVVGVVGDVRYTKLTESAWAEIYYPEALFPQAEFTLLIRTASRPEQFKSTVERMIRDVEPEAIVTDGHTMDEVVSRSLARERFLMLLLSTFSLGAFALSITGHYGVVAYAVSQRRQEIGIRMALGASPASIVKIFVAEGLTLSSAGLVVGVLASLALSRVIRSELYGVSATDPWTLAASVAVLLAAATIASLSPSYRAARVQPAEVLREG